MLASIGYAVAYTGVGIALLTAPRPLTRRMRGVASRTTDGR